MTMDDWLRGFITGGLFGYLIGGVMIAAAIFVAEQWGRDRERRGVK
jgi:hypothetical protein